MRIIIRDVNGNTLYRADTGGTSRRSDVIDVEEVLDRTILLVDSRLSDNGESIVVTVHLRDEDEDDAT